MRDSVLVTCPNTGWLHRSVAAAQLLIALDQRFDVTVMNPAARPYVHNLHLIQQVFLDKGFDYWLSFDDDNPPLRNPLDLIEHDYDVVGIPTPIWQNYQRDAPGDRPWSWNVMMEKEHGYTPLQDCEQFDGTGTYEVHAVGSGCMLIARRVMEKLDAPFMRRWSDKGIAERGCDFEFCRKAREAGFKIWADFEYKSDHILEISALEMLNAFYSEVRKTDG